MAERQVEGLAVVAVEIRPWRLEARAHGSAIPPKRSRCYRSGGLGHHQTLRPPEVPAGSAAPRPLEVPAGSAAERLAAAELRGAPLHCGLDRTPLVAYTGRLVEARAVVILRTVRHELYPHVLRAQRVASFANQMVPLSGFDHGPEQGERLSNCFQTAVRAQHQPEQPNRTHSYR